MKSLCIAAAMLVATAGLAAAEPKTFVVTSSNNPAGNQLLVYDAAGNFIQAAPTGGLGGVAGNAGGIAATRDSIAVVNFQSQSVSIFDVTDAGVQFRQAITTLSSPVSVAFGKDHLYVLGTTTVESHRLAGRDVTSAPDGSESLVVGDGFAAQVGALANALLITEKSNVVETVGLERRNGQRSPPMRSRFRRAAIRPSVLRRAGPTVTSRSPIPTKSGW